MSADPVLDALLHGSPFQAYAYAYPHKTAYGPLSPAPPLRDVWADEPQGALLLYVHVPFCEFRCGFCNLFTKANPSRGVVGPWLDAVARQAAQVAAALPDARYARLALGGGTPTWLEPDELGRVFDLAADLGARGVPASVELSPDTATPDRVAVLLERGVDRVSLGVQSFDEAETRAVSRPQRRSVVERALGVLRGAARWRLNVDLVYGLPGQTVASWLDSLRRALDAGPDELYLYPLYVRPLTGLGLGSRSWDDERLALYRAAREVLLGLGWRQRSLRMFVAPTHPGEAGPAWSCQDDGTVGLGPGARSYTRTLHASTEYAVAQAGVGEILAAYLARSDDEHGRVAWGFRLDGGEQRRRWAIQSLLQADGLDADAYAARFGTEAGADLAELDVLAEHGLARPDGRTLRLTDAGLERSDAIGPFLASPGVRARTEGHRPR